MKKKRCECQLNVLPYPANFALMTITHANFNRSKAFGGISFTGIHDKVAESVEQNQTARMCKLILLYTLLRIKLHGRNLQRTGFKTLELCSNTVLRSSPTQKSSCEGFRVAIRFIKSAST